MVADVLMYEDDFVVNRSREGIGLCEEVVFWVIFDGADEGGLLSRRQILIMGDFLEVTANVRAMSMTDVNAGLYEEVEGV